MDFIDLDKVCSCWWDMKGIWEHLSKLFPPPEPDAPRCGAGGPVTATAKDSVAICDRLPGHAGPHVYWAAPGRNVWNIWGNDEQMQSVITVIRLLK